MSYFRHLLFSAIIINSFFIGSAHALLVDWEESPYNTAAFGALTSFLGDNLDYTGMSIDPSHKLLSDPGGRDITFGDNDGIKFSNGVLLKDPGALPSDGGDGGP